jgi:hypothetical protein
VRVPAEWRRLRGILAAGLVLLALPPAAAALELVGRGASWSYLDNGTDQGTAWKDPGFDDGAWSSGASQLGYGDGDEDTAVGFGGDPLNKFITTYFRHEFQVADPNSLQGLTLHLMRDDGAIVYLNGEEVYRNGVPAGPVNYLTPANITVGGAAEDTFLVVALDPNDIDPGANVIAVEIHQVSSTSSDITLELELLTGPPDILRGPYLHVATPGSAIVRWRTDLPTESRVSFGLSPLSLSTTVTEPGPTTDHEVELTGLDPNTVYFYEVGTSTLTLAGGDSNHSFRTAPTPGAQGPIRIWAIGDSGRCSVNQTGCNNATAVANAYLSFAGSRLADVWMMLGDNAYPIGTDNQYTAGVFDTYPNILRNHVLWPSPGNHEFGASDSPTQTGPYYEAFSMPTAGEAGGWASGSEAYYSFDYGNVHFVVLDSHDTSRDAPADPTTNVCPGGQGGAMYQWLCTDLANTDKDWVIAYWHHPPYSKGSHDSDDPNDSAGILFEMRERFVPVLEHFGVDLQLTGHSHSYERSMLIDGHYGTSDEFGPQHVIDGGDGDPNGNGAYAKPTLGPAPHEGTVYSVVGSSSLTSGGTLDHPVMVVSINDLGSMVIDVEGSVLDGYWIDDTGAVRDHFRIAKGSAPVPALSPSALAAAAALLALSALGRLVFTQPPRTSTASGIT